MDYSTVICAMIRYPYGRVKQNEKEKQYKKIQKYITNETQHQQQQKQQHHHQRQTAMAISAKDAM